MNKFYSYAGSVAFRVELSRPQIAKIYEVGKCARTGDFHFSVYGRNDLIKIYGGHDNFLLTERALIRRGIIEDIRHLGLKPNVKLTPEGDALYSLLDTAGFFVEFEKVYENYLAICKQVG